MKDLSKLETPKEEEEETSIINNLNFDNKHVCESIHIDLILDS